MFYRTFNALRKNGSRENAKEMIIRHLLDLSERQRISLLNSPDAEDIFSFKKDLKSF